MCEIELHQEARSEFVMKQKHKPRPITSFMEDEIDFDSLKKEIQKGAQIEIQAELDARRRRRLIAAIRVAIAIVSAILALLLYIMVDDFLSHRQAQRFQRIVNLVN